MSKGMATGILALLCMAQPVGCSLDSLVHRQCTGPSCYTPDATPTSGPAAMSIEEPCIEQHCMEPWREVFNPMDLTEERISAENTLPLSLEQCIQMALTDTTVLRDLGATLVRTPGAAGTSLDPSLIYTDPRFGQEAALAAFDANLSASLRFDDIDRGFNNRFIGSAGLLRQDLQTYQWGASKRSATGGTYSFRNVTIYDYTNQLSTLFGPLSFDTYLEGEIRQPILQGAGTEFNRIAGPNATPGAINGVVVARVRQDIGLAEFRLQLRDLVADVENAYWDLYFAYRDLEAKIEVRDEAYEVWTKQKNRKDELGSATSENTVSESASADAEQAREQYFRFQAEVVDSLSGRPVDATRVNNGTTGGTFRGSGGLRTAERRLRLIVGLPINDGRIIRPTDVPTQSPVIYDWESAISQAMVRREELSRQRWVIKQRELELVANRNFLLPQAEIVGTYRMRGFGDELINQSGRDSALESLARGQFHELSAGVEMSMPIGFRQANAAVRNSLIALTRERAILREQERYVHFGLSNAFSELRRSFDNRQIQNERLDATAKQINSLESRRTAGVDDVPLDVLLEAYRRLLDIKLGYHRAEIDYALAIRNIQLEKGTLLEYCNVLVSEGQWSSEAYGDAAERDKLRGAPHVPAERDPVVATPATG
jgi:hypothetical protein